MTTSPLPEDYRIAIAREAARLGPFADEWHFFESLTSTNDIAAQMLPSVDRAPVVVAHAQTAGRGRRGRAWFSPPGAGLYVSVALPHRVLADVTRISRVTLMVAVALAEALERSAGVTPEIKWPNDLIIQRRKIAGILVEARSAAAVEHVVIGFGINLLRQTYPIELEDRATSLEAECGRGVARADVLIEALAGLADGLDDLGAGRFDAILSRWRRRSPSSVGAPVEWSAANGPQRGLTAGIDETGALLIRAGSTVERVIGGEVRWL